MLVHVLGAPGSGKTTLGRRLAAGGVPVVDTDDVLFAVADEQLRVPAVLARVRAGAMAGYGVADFFAPAYEPVLARVLRRLAGAPGPAGARPAPVVVLTGLFCPPALREAAGAGAGGPRGAAGSPFAGLFGGFLGIALDVPPEEAYRRAQRRTLAHAVAKARALDRMARTLPPHEFRLRALLAGLVVPFPDRPPQGAPRAPPPGYLRLAPQRAYALAWALATRPSAGAAAAAAAAARRRPPASSPAGTAVRPLPAAAAARVERRLARAAPPRV